VGAVTDELRKRPIKNRTTANLPPEGEWLTAPPRTPLTGVPGVYKVHLRRPGDPLRDSSIPRIAGIDDTGTILIGQTTDLGTRRRQFRSGLTGKIRKGEGGFLQFLDVVCPGLRRLYGPPRELMNNLYLTYIEVKPKLLILRESQAIDRYVNLYGEPPVLNSQIPGRLRYYSLGV
jgi:hypothetical protein